MRDIAVRELGSLGSSDNPHSVEAIVVSKSVERTLVRASLHRNCTHSVSSRNAQKQRRVLPLYDKPFSRVSQASLSLMLSIQNFKLILIIIGVN